MYHETIVEQIMMLGETNAALKKRIDNPTWENAREACRVSEAINKNVETIASLAADLEEHDNPKPVIQERKKGRKPDG